MKTIITYGTFDMFHIGHLNLIKRLRDLGDKVIVAVSTDEFNESKGKKCLIPFEHRIEIVKNIVGVDIVIAENDWGQKVSDIVKYNVDIFVMGDDWKGKFDDLSSYCQVMYLPRTDGVSTTYLKSILSNVSPSLKEDIEKSFKILESIRNSLT
ncbi:adenylyltransferase/cytidyltransferase family protein [Aeromonas veronii]|uniref:adenylyltransferase/cytidyltransferase family protein n=1 Tax=Aeromonas veronii TaxID=654 RepID=UPI0030079DA5